MIGLLAVADASAPSAVRTFDDRFHFVKQQTFWAIIGFAILVFSANIKYTIWEKLAVPIFVVTIILLITVLIPGLGSNRLGAQRWIDLGFISFQPSEVLKLSLAIYLAKVASVRKNLPAYFLPLGISILLVMLQPDLGTTIVVTAIGMVQIYLAGISILYFVGAGIVAVVGALALIFTSDYRRARLMTYLQLGNDPLGDSYHIRQILFALGSGGLWGLGIGQSRQKYLYLPEPETDSIFAVIGEEIGFVGSTLLILILVAFILRALKIAKRAPDTFSYILGAGLVAWIGIQILINIAAMVALVPLTGIPLPFISYGGTSLVMVMFATGILLNISRYGQEK